MTLTAEQKALKPTRGLGPVQRLYAVEGIEVRAQQENPNLLDFYGHASVTNKPYEMYGGPDKGGWNESVDRGAFKKTLAANPDVVFKLNHEGMTLARTKSGTLSLAEDKVGLEVKASMDKRISAVNDIAVAMERGDLDEMSFAFRVTEDQWLDAEGAEVPWWDLAGIDRHIRAVDLGYGDVSVVNFGANPFTDASLRTEDFLGALREVRAGATLSGATLATLNSVLGLISTADDGLDDAQDILANLMGVPNPDDPDGDTTDAPMQLSCWDALLTLHSKRLPAA